MNRLLHFIGIAYRAGTVKKGAFLTEKAIKEGSALLVILAEDASENTKDKFISQCKYYGVECFAAESKAMLGAVSGGGTNRSVLAMTDQGFAKRTEEMLLESGHMSLTGNVNQDND